MSAKFECLITEATRNHAGLTFGVELVHEADQGRMLALIGNELSKRKISCTIDIGEAKPNAAMKIDRYEMYTRFDGSVELVIDPDGSVCYTRDVAKLEALNAELLEVLENVYYPILSWLGEFDSESSLLLPTAMQKARAAIAKAKGEDHG